MNAKRLVRMTAAAVAVTTVMVGATSLGNVGAFSARAELPGTGSISGQVTAADGASPIQGAMVCVNDMATGEPIPCDPRTDADGMYTVQGLPEGSDYLVHVQADGYAHQVWDHTYYWDSYAPVSVTAGQETTNIDFALVEGGGFAGTVKDYLGNPIVGLDIWALQRTDAGWGATWHGTTKSDGAYEVKWLEAGNYVAYIDPPPGYAVQVWNHKIDFTFFDLVPVNAGQTEPGIDFDLVPGASIRGTVSDVNGPIAQLLVRAETWDHGNLGGVWTASDGSYDFYGLPFGDYRVYVNAPGYPRMYYDDVFNSDDAEPVRVDPNAGDTLDIDFFLRQPNTPSGDNVGVSPQAGIDITFGTVSAPGDTTVTVTSTFPNPPGGYSLGNTPLYYEISTTANYSEGVDLCFGYDPADFANPALVNLLHFENDAWIDVTTFNDPLNGSVCGHAASLSPFVVAGQLFTFAGFKPPVDNPPVVNEANAGQAIPIKWTLTDKDGAFITSTTSVKRFAFSANSQYACSSASTSDIEQYVAGDMTGIRYDPEAHEFILTYKTDKTWASSCKVFTLELADGTVHQAIFNFVK